VFTFMGTWNDFLWPLIVLSDEDLHTLPVALASLLGEHAQDVELMMAGSVLTVLPVVALFALFQRQYIQGIVAGSVRGAVVGVGVSVSVRVRRGRAAAAAGRPGSARSGRSRTAPTRTRASRSPARATCRRRRS